MHAPSISAAGRLCALAIALALGTSRLTLLFHEFLGHGGVAIASGGRVTEWHLFLFAGGRIEFELPEGLSWWWELAIQLGGCALEGVVAPLALLAARRSRGALAMGLYALASIDAVHALVYVGRGTHYGYGDGIMLHEALGAAGRFAIAGGATAGAVAIAYAGARAFARHAGEAIPAASGRVRLGALVAAVAVAGGVHAALAFGELSLVPDPAYARLMEDRALVEVRRVVEAERRTAPPTPEELERLARLRAAATAPFPLDPVLFGGIAVGLAAGAWGGVRRAGRGERLPWRSVGVAFAVLGALLGVIAGIG